MLTTDLGFKPFKAVSRVAKGAAKGVAKGAKTAAKTAVKVAMLPVTLQLQIIQKVMVPIARTLCQAPEPVLRMGAAAAGVNPNVVPLFCQAVRVKNMSQVRALLPQVMKIAVKVAATGAFPAIGPALAAVRMIPGIKMVPGLSFLAGANGGYVDLEGLDGEMLGQLTEELLSGVTDEELGATFNIANVGVGVALGISLIAIGMGLFTVFSET